MEVPLKLFVRDVDGVQRIGLTNPKSIVRSWLLLVASVTAAGLPWLSLGVVLPAAFDVVGVRPAGVATVTVYTPAGSPVNRYLPLASVVVVRVPTGPVSVTV